MFFGSYEHQIDDRGRIRIPTPFKDGLGDEFFVVFGTNNSLNLYPKNVIEEQYTTLQSKTSFLNVKDQEALKAFSSRLSSVTLDKQGRLTLSVKMLKFGNLLDVKDVTSTGMGDHVCISKQIDYSDEDFANALEYLSQK